MAQRLSFVIVLLATCTLLAQPKPVERPAKPEVDGKVPAPLTVDHFQTETPPAKIPTALLDFKSAKNAPTAGTIGQALLGLNPTIVPVSATLNLLENESNAKAALEMAESHFKACNADEARQWYREVVKLAPQSQYAALAGSRLQRETITVQSAEPPLLPRPQTAEPPLAKFDVSDLKLKVLWEAAKQYKDAVENGDRAHIERCSKVLETALKATREPMTTSQSR
jgi:tetratricopeptide (TPR) repeat protein